MRIKGNGGGWRHELGVRARKARAAAKAMARKERAAAKAKAETALFRADPVNYMQPEDRAEKRAAARAVGAAARWVAEGAKVEGMLDRARKSGAPRDVLRRLERASDHAAKRAAGAVRAAEARAAAFAKKPAGQK